MFIEDAIFPACPSFGFTSEPRYSVTKIGVASGRTYRTINWSRPLHMYTAEVNPRAMDEIQDVLEFWHGVSGTGYGFRFSDGNDYKSCQVQQTVSATDQPLYLREGESPDTYQLVKEYSAGSRVQIREIYKPKAGILISDNGTPKTEGVDWVLDYTSGMVALNFSPVGPLTWGGEFDVPVSFDSEFPVQLLNKQIQGVSFQIMELRREDAIDLFSS